MDFKFIDEAISKLDAFSSKDVKYKTITDQIANLLSNLGVEFLSFKTAHDNVLKETFNTQSNIKKIHEKKIEILQQSFEVYKDEIKNKIENLRRVRAESVALIDSEIQLTVSKFENELSELKTVYEEKTSTNEITKSKEISYIEKLVSEIKKESAKSIAQVELNYKTDIQKVEKRYQNFETHYNDRIKAFEEKTSEEKAKIQLVKNEYREQSDTKYLNIKSEYHNQSTAFNNKVDSIKKKRGENYKKLFETFSLEIFPFEKEIEDIESNYQENTETLQADYEKKLASHLQKKDEIIENYNLHKQKIIRETSDAITLLNSKLSAYKEVLAKDRIENQKEHKQLLLSLSDSEKTQANKERNRKLRIQDNELNKQILRTQKENLLKTKEQYELLSNAESKYIEEISQWKVEEKVLALNFKLQNYNNYLNYQNRLKENEVNRKKLKITFDHQVELLNIEQLSQISPLESNLSIDNAMSERDVNLLSNDTNYHLNHYQIKEDILDHNLQIYKHEQKLVLDKEKLLLEHVKNVALITQQLSIEKENVIREQQLKNQELKKQLIIDTTFLNDSIEELNYLLKRSEIETKINYIHKERGIIHTFYDKNLKIDIDTLKTDLSFEEERLELTENIELINRDLGILSKDLNVIHSRIHYFFNQIYVLYNIQHHLMLKLVSLYQLPAHPEDVKQFISLCTEIFKELRAVQENAKDDFLIDIKNFHEVKINDITGQKFNSSLVELEEELKNKLSDYDEDKKHIETSITKIDYQIQVLGNNVDKIQSNINRIEQIKLDETNRKQARAYQSEIDHYTRQINSIEIEMNGLEKEIERHRKPIEKIEQQKDILKQKFELDKKSLYTKQKLDAKVYFEQLSFYQNFMKKLSNLFSSYENKVLLLTNKLNQPIYLTDNLIKDAQKAFLRLEDSFERQSNQHYQDLLKYSIQVFDKLNDEQSTLKDNYERSLQKNITLNKKKNDSLKFLKNQQIIRHNQNLNNVKLEEQTYIKSLSLNLTREKQPQIDDLRNSIKHLETQIMAAEEKLKNELFLIDDNLKSVVDQMKLEHQKNLDRTHEAYLKNIAKANDLMDNKQKNLKQLEESTKVKNQLLFTRFTQNENKIKDQLKVKLTNLAEQTSKEELNYKKRIESLVNDLENLYVKHNQLINEETKKSKQLASQFEKSEKKNQDKDIKDAKKSYEYKIKALKL